MKASELINKLQTLIKEYGDCDITANVDWQKIQSVGYMERSFTNDGNPAFELYEIDPFEYARKQFINND